MASLVANEREIWRFLRDFDNNNHSNQHAATSLVVVSVGAHIFFCVNTNNNKIQRTIIATNRVENNRVNNSFANECENLLASKHILSADNNSWK